VDPAAEMQPPEPEAPPGRIALWNAALQARRSALEERAAHERSRHQSLDACFEIVDRDVELGGGIIAGALAYRFFIWLLPLALVAVAGLGFAADAAEQTPKQAVDELGLAGLVSSSVASAAEGSGRWYALLIGIPILVWATRSMLRALIGTHRLLWTDARKRAPKPTVLATLRLLGLILVYGAATVFASAVRANDEIGGILTTTVIAVPYAAIWLLVSIRLPHRDAPWTALIPGALVLAVGLEALHIVTAYFLGPWALSKQGTYGALGVSAGLLLGLFLVSRLIVASAVINATLWERRLRDAGGAAPSA
jgi:membrane protein